MKKYLALFSLLIVFTIGFVQATPIPDINKHCLEQVEFIPTSSIEVSTVYAEVTTFNEFQTTLFCSGNTLGTYLTDKTLSFTIVLPCEVGFRHLFNAKILKWIYTNNI